MNRDAASLLLRGLPAVYPGSSPAPASRSVEGRRYGLALLTGVMLALAFPKIGLGWLAWPAPGLLLALCAGQPGGRAFRLGFTSGLGRYLISLYWFLLIPKPGYALAAWVAMSAVLSLFVGAWCWICCRAWPQKAGFTDNATGQGPQPLRPRRSPLWKGAVWPLFCAAAWVAMEMGFAHVLTGFPWNLLGASQYRVLPLIQVASVAGVYGVSFLVVWVSAAVVAALASWGSAAGGRRSLGPVWAPPLLTLLAVLAFGWKQLSVPDPAGARLKVALIQPSIPQRVIWDPAEKTNRLRSLVALSKAALSARPDLLVWPEAAVPGALARTRETQDMVASLVRAGHVWMVFGGEDFGRRRSPDGEEVVDELNSAFLVNPAGDLAARYHKRHLVAFGEYMPGAAWLPFLKRFRERGGGFASGKRPIFFALDQPRARLAVLICFEDVFPHLAREHVDEETDFLLNLTNNGWFGESAAQWQHAISALFRAVENGVPLVRCANNGLTCWIDPRGRVHELYFPGSADVYQAGYKLVDVPLRPPGDRGWRTFYNRWGDWLGWGCVAATLGVLARFAYAEIRQQR